MAQAPEPGEIPMAKSSKSKKPVVSATSPNKKPSPRGRKGGDKVFRQNDELYRLFVDSIKDYAILMLDPTGHVLSWNPGAELLKGYHADEIIGKHFSIFYPREDVEHGKPEMELRVATNENRFEDEGWRVRKDGSRFWANVVITALHKDAGVLMGFAKVIRDMTERRAGEDALREAEERMRSVVNHVIDGIITIDERGMVESFNPAAEKIFGYPAVEVVGRNVKMLMPEPYHSGHDGYLTNYFRTHQPKIIGIGREVEGLRSDGSTFPMELAVSEFHARGAPLLYRHRPRYHPAQAVGGREGQVSRERQRGGVSPGDHQHGDSRNRPAAGRRCRGAGKRRRPDRDHRRPGCSDRRAGSAASQGCRRGRFAHPGDRPEGPAGRRRLDRRPGKTPGTGGVNRRKHPDVGRASSGHWRDHRHRE